MKISYFDTLSGGVGDDSWQLGDQAIASLQEPGRIRSPSAAEIIGFPRLMVTIKSSSAMATILPRLEMATTL